MYSKYLFYNEQIQVEDGKCQSVPEGSWTLPFSYLSLTLWGCLCGLEWVSRPASNYHL